MTDVGPINRMLTEKSHFDEYVLSEGEQAREKKNPKISLERSILFCQGFANHTAVLLRRKRKITNDYCKEMNV